MSSALFKELRKAAHALNAIGLCAKLASIFGVKPRLLLNASRVGFDSGGTCSGFRAVVLGMVIFLKLSVYLMEYFSGQHFVHRQRAEFLP